MTAPVKFSERAALALEQIAASLQRLEAALSPEAIVQRERATYWAKRCQPAAAVLIDRLMRLATSAADRKSVEAVAVGLPRLMTPDREPSCGWLDAAKEVPLAGADWAVVVSGQHLRRIEGMVKREGG